MHNPMTQAEKAAKRKAEEENQDEENSTTREDSADPLKKQDKPLGYDQQVEVKTTLTRGPMFSEVR